MTEEQQSIWNKIKGFELDDPTSSLMFSDRLSRENGWTVDYTLRCIFEYKRFMFLIFISKHPLTPSDQIDQVWHLHLLYTQSYWIDFCKECINKEIHHGPTKGGKNEGDKFTDWYLKTKELYTSTFNEQPPVDIWPSSKIRFRDINFQRVNLDKVWLIKKLF
jgi:hypothetical protein